MVKDTSSRFPWDQIKAESMRSICRDLGMKSGASRNSMVDFLESVPKVGLPKALDNASTARPPSAFTRTSQKRARDTGSNTVTTSHLNGTTTSSYSGDEHSPSKRHRLRLDVVSDYNTRFRSERRGRLSDPGLGRRRLASSAGPAAAAMSSISALVGGRGSVRSSRKGTRSTAARGASARVLRATISSGVSGRVRLGEPLASDETANDEDWEEDAEGEEQEDDPTSSASSIVVRRRARAPVTVSSPKTRGQKEEAVVTRRRKSLPSSRGRRVVRVNGAATADDAGEVVKPRRSKRPLSSTARPGTRSRSGARRKPSASPLKKLRRSTTTARPRGKSNGRTTTNASSRRATNGRSRVRVGAPSSGRLVFDGIEVPPLDKAVSSAMKKKEAMSLGDEDADGEEDDDVHAPHADAQKGEVKKKKAAPEDEETEADGEESGVEGENGEKAKRVEGEDEDESEENENGHGHGHDQGEQEQEQEQEGEQQPEPEQERGAQEEDDEQMLVNHPEQPGEEEAEEDEIGATIPDDTSSLGNSNKENEAPELPQDQGNDQGDQTMDTIGAAISGGAGDDTEIDENDLAAIAAAASLFGVSIAATTTTATVTSTVTTAAAAGFIGGSEPDTNDVGGNGPMDDLDMDSIDGMDGFISVSEQDLDDMGIVGGPHSYIA